LQSFPMTTKVGVLNQGIGGNAVISGGLGPTGYQRFDNDVLKQSGVRWMILAIGVNDIGYGDSTTAKNLTGFYKLFVTKAHAANILVYAVPLLPFNGSSYYTAEHEAARAVVNDWIRTPGNVDAVLDLDAAVRDPAKPDTLLAAYDSGDHLHPNPTGYQRMADAVDLCLFVE
jgi:lysophospholipase L1-like esterase